MFRFLTIVIFVILSGCSTSGHSPDTIDGLYEGFLVNGGTHRSFAMISEDKIIRLVAPNFGGQAIGKLTVIGNKFKTTLDHYINPFGNDIFTTKSSFVTQLDLTITNGEINGTWSASNGSGLMTLNKRKGLVIGLAQLSSNWTLNLAGSSGGIYTLSISIDSQGLITGSDTTGCIFLGNVVDQTKTGSVIPFDLNMTSCGSYDGDYHGLMTIMPNDMLQMLASNNTHAFTAGLFR